MFIDLNKFKAINDNFGHSEGDEALRNFSACLQIGFRDSDVYGRLGGDEFAVLLVNTNEAEAKIVLDRFKMEIDTYNKGSKKPYELNFSYGVVQFDPEQPKSLEDLLKIGDEKMYENKKNR